MNKEILVLQGVMLCSIFLFAILCYLFLNKKVKNKNVHDIAIHSYCEGGIFISTKTKHIAKNGGFEL